VTLRDVIGLLEQMYDPSWADEWDAVGLVCGDPDETVRRILFAVDPAHPVVAEAADWGADLVVVHHPLLLKPVHSVAADTPKGRLVHDLVRGGRALYCAHTNADAPAYGVNEALARALGVRDPEVIVPAVGEPVDKLVTFAPHENAEEIRAAITEAGTITSGSRTPSALASASLTPYAGASAFVCAQYNARPPRTRS